MKNHLQLEEQLWQKYWRSRDTDESRLIRAARDELVLWYSARKNSLVERMAKRMVNYLGLDIECLNDLINDSLLCVDGRKEGLVFAVEQFDPGRGVIFPVFARKYIWYAMLHGETARNGLKPYQISISKRLRRLHSEFEVQYHYHPTLSELAKFSGISIQQLKRMEQAGWTMNPNSLDEYLHGENSEEGMERDVVDQDALNPEESLIKKENEAAFEWVSQFLYVLRDKDDDLPIEDENIRQAMEKLKKNELQVLLLRFLYDMDHEQIASKMGVSVGNARVILSRALDRLRKCLSS